RAIYRADDLVRAIDALDSVVPSALQTELHLCLKQHLQRQSLWLLKHGPQPLAIEPSVARYEEGVRLLAAELLPHATPALRMRVEQKQADFMARGVPQALARDIAMLELNGAAGDIVSIAEAAGTPSLVAGRALFTLSEALTLDRLEILIREM